MEDLQDKIIELMDLFDDEQVTTADKIDRPQRALDREAIDDFMKRNPMAGGGMLVQPSADGSRPGYAKDKTGWKEETEKLLRWIENNRDTFDFANSSSTDVLKESKVNLSVGTVQKYLANEGIQTKTAIAKTQDKPKYTKKVLEELREGLPKGISIEETRPGQYYYKIMLKGGKANQPTYRKSMVANEANKKLIIEDFNRVSKEYYPGRITDEEFKNLRLANKDMTTEEFAKFLDGKNKTTYLGDKWNKRSVSSVQNRLNIGVGTTGPLVKRTVEEARAIIDQYPGAKFFYLQNPSDSEITRYAADLVSQEKTGAKGGKKGFPVGSTKENKMFRNFYDSSLKPNGRMQLITKIPTDADGRINWKKKDANGVPEWKKAKFFDKKTGATFSWGAKYKPGDLAKQVDAAYGQGFFAKSVKVYDEQAAINKQKFKGRSLNEIFREGLLKKELEIKLDRPLTNSKADQKLLQEFYALRKPSFSFTEAHHIEGVGENPFRMELSYRAANRKQNNLLNSYNAGNLTKAEYISEMENLADTKGGIRYKTDGRFIGTTATPETIIKSAAQDIDMKPSQLNKLLLNFASTVTNKCSIGNADGGRIGYSLGSEACLKIGKEALDNGLLKGFKNKQQVDLAGLILKGGAGLKSAFALRNIFGPAAIAATVAFEGGLIGYDMLTSGKTLREAFGDNLLNYALGKDYQIDPQEELFKRFTGLGYDDQQIGSIKRSLDTMNTINTGAQLAMDVGQQQEALKKSRGQPEPFMGPEDQFIADTSAQRAEQNLKDAQERLTAFNQSLEAVDRPGGMKKEDVLQQYIQSGEYAKGFDLFKKAQKEADIQKLESAGPKVMGSVFPQFEEGRQLDLNTLRSVENPYPRLLRDSGYLGLAEGGRAGYRLGKVVKVKPSKARTDVKSIVDENIKLMKQMKETGEIDEISSDLNQVIKKALDEDLFDKKDRIIDSINISETKKRKNLPYNMRVFEEPKNLDFYDSIIQSNFRTKTGPYFDRIRRLKRAGGGLLKQAGDRSGPPPESGPNSQGLQGLLNRVKKV